MILPPLLAKTWLKDMYLKMGVARYSVFIVLIITALTLPIKMYLRWMFNLKYIIAIPEYFFQFLNGQSDTDYMINQQERYYNILKLNKWFAISSILFTLIWVLTFANDFNRPWKKYQIQFRQMEIEKTRADIAVVNQEFRK